MEFYTNDYSFRQMEHSEIRELEVGEKISICINNDIPHKMEFIDTTVVRPAFKDNNRWKVETANGLVDEYDIYEIRNL